MSSTRCCFCLFFTLGFVVLLLWLCFMASKPSCTIKYFYVPALNKWLDSTTDTAINLELYLKNTNIDKGVYYDPVNITFYQRSTLVGALIIPGFYQGHGKGAKRTNSVETHSVNWGAARAEVSKRAAFFRVELATTVRYKIMAWKTERQRLAVGADVLVNDEGMKDNKKGIKLKSGAMRMAWWKMGGVLLNIMVMEFLN